MLLFSVLFPKFSVQCSDLCVIFSILSHYIHLADLLARHVSVDSMATIKNILDFPLKWYTLSMPRDNEI
jgi:hypothetical protein